MATPSQKDSSANRNDVWADVRGKTVHGTYSVSVDGNWIEVIGDDGRYKSAAIGNDSADEVAERLLRELYMRSSGAVDD